MIKIDRWTIDGYEHAWTVTETIETNKKGGGKGTRNVVKYYPTLRQCLESVADKTLKDAADIDAILKRIDELSALIEQVSTTKP